jgi:hypothetical protein
MGKYDSGNQAACPGFSEEHRFRTNPKEIAGRRSEMECGISATVLQYTKLNFREFGGMSTQTGLHPVTILGSNCRVMGWPEPFGVMLMVLVTVSSRLEHM